MKKQRHKRSLEENYNIEALVLVDFSIYDRYKLIKNCENIFEYCFLSKYNDEFPNQVAVLMDIDNIRVDALYVIF